MSDRETLIMSWRYSDEHDVTYLYKYTTEPSKKMLCDWGETPIKDLSDDIRARVAILDAVAEDNKVLVGINGVGERMTYKDAGGYIRYEFDGEIDLSKNT